MKKRVKKTFQGQTVPSQFANLFPFFMLGDKISTNERKCYCRLKFSIWDIIDGLATVSYSNYNSNVIQNPQKKLPQYGHRQLEQYTPLCWLDWREQRSQVFECSEPSVSTH